MRWTQLIGADTTTTTIRNTATLRRRLLILAGRITTSGKRLSLRLPTGWPWADTFLRILTRLRALPAIA